VVIDSLVFVKVEETELMISLVMGLAIGWEAGQGHTASFISSRCSSVMLLKGAEGPAL